MAHAFWKGSLSFGLVEIGVSLRPAEAASDLAFTLLDRNDFSPVGNKRYNKKTGREVPWERVVRGYEYEPDQYVVLTDEELASANAEASRTIEVVSFVDRNEIEPIYYGTPYYVEPQTRSSKAYALLREALVETGLVGIVRVVLRTRQHMAALLVRDRALMLELLRYPDELRKPEAGEGTNGKAKPSPAELRMAVRLVSEMREKFDPEAFRDDYRQDVMAMIEKKIRSGKTHEIVTEGPEQPKRATREVVDLMSVLKQSIERRAAAGSERPRRRWATPQAAEGPQRRPARRAPERKRATERRRA